MLSRIKKMLTPYTPEFELPGYKPARGYDLLVPEGEGPFPLVIALHGYTHDGQRMRALSSPNGDPEHSDSLDSLALRERFALCYPNGTSIKFMPGRCWNAGGGVNGFAPVGDPARKQNINDVEYVDRLLEELQGKVSYDQQRIYLLGISNGGAMAQRLAMTHPSRWAAVATVAGCNQHAASLEEIPPAPMPLLHIHGTEDPIWPYAGGDFAQAGLMVSVEESLKIWRQANSANEKTELQFKSGDGGECPVLHTQYRGSSERSDIDHYKVVGGGHAWPGGHKYLPQPVIGVTPYNFRANEVIWDFFQGRTAP